MSIIDAAAKKVTDTLAANVNGANRLKFTPDGKLAIVAAPTRYDHYSLLRTIEYFFGLATLTANDAAAAPMTEFLR